MLKHTFTVPFSLKACRQCNDMLPNLTLHHIASYVPEPEKVWVVGDQIFWEIQGK